MTAQETLGSRRKLFVLLMLLLLLMPLGTEAKRSNQSTEIGPSDIHGILVDAVSWKTFSVYCEAGEILSGSFQVVKDGDLFIGDLKNYDYWLLEGIDFFICSEASLESWENGEDLDALFEQSNVAKLTWSVEIPSAGTWYIVYWNDTVYMKTVEGSFFRESDAALPLVYGILVVGSVGLLIVLGIIVRSIRTRS
ncbi:MAG: hypothetical protein ACFFD9_10185 [Candidatus Thorarchaeota archaeon]